MGPAHNLSKRKIMSEVHVLFQIDCGHRIDDQVLEGMCPCWVTLCCLVLVQEALQFLKPFIKSSLRHNGLHMIDERCITAAFCQGTLGRIIGIVNIEVRDRAGNDIRKTGLREPEPFAR